MRIGAVVLARSDSTRLPGKVLRPLAGRPLLTHILEVCRRTAGVDVTIVATTARSIDDNLARLVRAERVEVYRGATNDVARRLFNAMEEYGLDAAARVNADSPLQRPSLLAEGISRFRRETVDLVTNVPGRTYPYGMSVEVVSTTAMKEALEMMAQGHCDENAEYREHVTKIFYDRSDVFEVVRLPPGPSIAGAVRLAVDEPADLIRAEAIANALGDRLYSATLEEVVALALSYDSGRTQGENLESVS
jgi:spore coat polysaccharide biosynthesis protein SpsF